MRIGINGLFHAEGGSLKNLRQLIRVWNSTGELQRHELVLFASRHTRDKLADVPCRPGRLGPPVLDECYAHFECRIVNAMDTGSSTCFLADVQNVGYGASTAPRGEVMTATYFRANLPAAWKPEYLELLAAAQRFALERSGDIRPLVWRGVKA